MIDLSAAAPGWDIVVGEAEQALATQADGTVSTIVTSPPFYGLRVYDGIPGLGNEATPEEYVSNLADILDEAKRCLHKTGTLWLNLGDSYNGSGGAGGDYGPGGKREGQEKFPGRNLPGMKKKDLIGVPWMVAFELRRRGWYLRSETIWAKRNPSPEGPRDRFARAHEQVFLLAKHAHPYFDWWKVMEPTVDGNAMRRRRTVLDAPWDDDLEAIVNEVMERGGVMLTGTSSYKGAHFATFPPALVEPLLAATAPEAGVCATCAAPAVRVVAKVGQTAYERHGGAAAYEGWREHADGQGRNAQPNHVGGTRDANGTTPDLTSPSYVHEAWKRTCKHEGALVPALVMDPFSGAATTGLVALSNGHRYLGIEKVPAYADLGAERLRSLGIMGLRGNVRTETSPIPQEVLAHI